MGLYQMQQYQGAQHNIMIISAGQFHLQKKSQ